MVAARKVKPVTANELDLGGAPPRAARGLKSNIPVPEPEVVAAPPRARRPRAAVVAGAPVKTVTLSDYVKIQIEENENVSPTGIFISINGRAYLVKPGVPVDVPPGVMEILNNAVEKMPVVDPQTRQVVGYRDKMRYPYRVLT